MKSYIYRIDNHETGEYYIGSRKCKTNKYDNLPNLDFGIAYRTSSKAVKDIGFEKFTLTFFKADFETHEDCYQHEQLLIREHINDPLCLNQFCCIDKTGRIYKMNAYNRVVTPETRSKISQAKRGQKYKTVRTGFSLSEETRKKISEARKGDPRKHLDDLNKPSLQCPHCLRFFNRGNFNRYHGDKCKLMVSREETS